MASAVEATVIGQLAPGIKGIPCEARVAPLCKEAAQLDDKAQRDAALSGLLSRWLQSDDHEVRFGAFRYLESIERFFDPRPLRREIERYDALEETSDGAAFLAWAELARAPRDSRLAVYRQAIVDGAAPIGGGASVPRGVAMIDGCLDGLDELRDLVREQYGTLSDEERLSHPLDELMANLDLRAGAKDREDADSRAAQRLAAMPSAELWAKCEASEGWRRAVASMAWDLERNFPESVAFKQVRAATAGLRREYQASMDRRVAALSPRKPGVTRQLSQHDQEVLDWFNHLP